MALTRTLKLTRPFLRGEDVERVQERLLELGFEEVGRADGVFGPDTDSALRLFQRARGLGVDGIFGEITRAALFDARPPETPSGTPGPWIDLLPPLTVNHGIFGSVEWRLAADGLRIEDAAPEVTPGRPLTVRRVWDALGRSISQWCDVFDVPVELVLATICTESRGNPEALRIEPGYVSDEATPHRISAGLMQTLISTAREALDDPSIDRDWLLIADNSIQAGTAYIGRQRRKTDLDPPKVACAYNAGSVIRNDSPGNRWKMRQFPIGTGHHADRFVAWFNDAFRVFETLDVPPDNAFWRALR
ncbi:MAG: peptidoglycan-binding protein [Kiloniellales bacterium]|nr:peptidoglycan-binding protein [Kiloniellales bacterium]